LALSVEIPREFAREYGDEIKFFHFLVHYRMKSLVFTTRTLPEFNRIMATFFKEFSEFSRDNG